MALLWRNRIFGNRKSEIEFEGYEVIQEMDYCILGKDDYSGYL